ncbi:MAG: hypothetical protein ACFB3T_02475 [Geminicoccaceae bacterium]
MNRMTIIASLSALMFSAIGAFWFAAEYARTARIGEYTAPGVLPMSAEAVAGDPEPLAAALLLAVYEAFGKTDEAAIYDGLARVADGDALEQLYLERAGAVAESGLTSSQSIHEMRIIGIETRYAGEGLEMAAQWQVIGSVEHGEHAHVRGNAYSADLRIEPVAGAWRITGFDLRDVDRTQAGVPVPQS